MIPTEKAKEDILKAYKIGKLGFERFVEERVFSHNVSLYDPIKQNNLKSFITREKDKKEAAKAFAVTADKQTFRRLLLIQEKRGVLMDVLSYELTICPLSIASPDGMVMKTAKYKLMQHLEKEISSLATHPMNCCIYDGMVLLQKSPTQLATFGDVSDYLLKKVTARCDILLCHGPI